MLQNTSVIQEIGRESQRKSWLMSFQICVQIVKIAKYRTKPERAGDQAMSERVCQETSERSTSQQQGNSPPVASQRTRFASDIQPSIPGSKPCSQSASRSMPASSSRSMSIKSEGQMGPLAAPSNTPASWPASTSCQSARSRTRCMQSSDKAIGCYRMYPNLLADHQQQRACQVSRNRCLQSSEPPEASICTPRSGPASSSNVSAKSVGSDVCSLPMGHPGALLTPLAFWPASQQLLACQDCQDPMSAVFQ